MNGNLSNTSVFGTDNINEIQEMYEEMTTGKFVCVDDVEDVLEEDADDYEVNSWETFVDLCDEGFVVVNGRLCRRD